MSEQGSCLEPQRAAVAPIYTGQDLFEDLMTNDDSRQRREKHSDPLERILRPVAKTYGEQDGRHKRK